ncbi:MAG: hypothetical protein CBC35_05315 [Planctomycetes bacterium TMED75]|nr:hypothetical protein [Planctomycetaceae bacterium]OUU93618.1 MAG: hypothetical protein CBC35_05315 [Planctomycetes bacterium TMED75]
MPRFHHLRILLASLFVLGGVPSVVAATSRDQAMDTSLNDELEAIALEIAELRDRNDSLHQRLDDSVEQPWLDASRSEAIRSLVQDVLADSSLRTNLQDTGLNVGYTLANGFHITTEDNSFHLRIMGESQVRWVFNRSRSGQQYSNADIVPDRSQNRQTVSGPETGWGFQIRNLKVKLLGHVVDPSWEFKIELAFRQDNAEAIFQDAYINKDLGDGFSFRVGQFKAPWLREQLVSSVFQLAADRSIIDGYFNAGRSVGFQGQYRNESLSLRAFYGNGFKSAMNTNSSFTNFANAPTNWAFAGRLDWKLFGNWTEMEDFNARSDQEPGVMLGVAAMGQKFNSNAAFNDPFNVDIASDQGPLSALFLRVPESIDGTEMYGITADFTAKFANWSFYAAAVWQRFDLTSSAEIDLPGVTGSLDLGFGSVNSWGAMVQSGYLLTDQVELFARYAYLAPDLNDTPIDFSGTVSGTPVFAQGSLALGSTTSSVLTLGTNYFITQNLKFTFDWGINFDPGFIGLSEKNLVKRGWVPTNTSSEWNLRFQTQLLF